MDKRYRLVAHPVGREREIPFEGKYTAKEIGDLVFIKTPNEHSAHELERLLREVRFEHFAIIVWEDLEFFAVEFPERMTLETARDMKRQMIERGLDASSAKTAAIHFDLTNEQYDQLVPLWDEA